MNSNLSAQKKLLVNNSFFVSIGTIKSIYYNSQNYQKHYLGFLSFQGGYKKWISDESGILFNIGLMGKGSVAECFEYCEQEHIFSITSKLRFESNIVNEKITYGIGIGVTNYTLNIDEMYNDSLNIISEALYENKTGLGIDFVVYYNLNRRWKIGLNYNPNIFEFREQKNRYYHTLFVELRYDIELE